MAIRVTCTCGKQFQVKVELAGKRGKCAACGQVLSIPAIPSSAALEKAIPAPLRACPICWEPLMPYAVICLRCGLDLRTGKQVPHIMPVAPSRPVANVPTSPGLFEFEDAVSSVPTAPGKKLTTAIDSKGGSRQVTRKILLFAGLGAGGFIAAAVALIVFLSNGPPQTSTSPRSDPAQTKEIRRQAEDAANPLAQTASLPNGPLRSSTLPVLAANPLEQAAYRPKEPRPARIVRQSGALPKNSPDEWRVALETATGINTSDLNVFLFLSDFNRLYDTTKFRDDESAKLISRMKIVPKAEIDIWNEALAKSVGGRLIPPLSNDSAALVVIIQQNLLFKEQKFDHAMSKVLCQRLATIPKSAIEEVTGIGKQYSALEGTDAALAIAKYDPLFVDNVFQPQVWQALKR